MRKKTLPFKLVFFIYDFLKNQILLSYKGHSIYPGCINENSLVIDVGANRGDFSAQLNRDFGCECIAIEPTPDSYNLISENKKVRKFNFAICKTSGNVNFFISNDSESNTIVKDISSSWAATRIITVPGINFEEFLQRESVDSIDVLKIDIEGAEIELFESLGDETIGRVKQLTVEFHDFLKNFRIKNDIISIKNRLIGLGFLCLTVRENIDVLFINTRKINFSLREQCYILCLRVIYSHRIRLILEKFLFLKKSSS